MTSNQYSTEKPPIVLIHGLWMTPRSWEHWVARYESYGYCVLTPTYPGFEGEVEALRADPSPIAKLSIDAVGPPRLQAARQGAAALHLRQRRPHHARVRQQSELQAYLNSDAVTDYTEFAGRCHYTCGQEGWEPVADYALAWATHQLDRQAS